MTTKNEDSTSESVSMRTTFNFVLSGVMALLVAIQTWEIKEIVDIEAKISLIQGSMLKAADGLDIWKAISDIKKDIAVLPTQAPPKWFVDKMDQNQSYIKQQVDELKSETASLKNKIDEHVAVSHQNTK